jgi:hypothetical protein
MICTKLRSIRPLSITRPNRRTARSGSATVSQAVSRAGMSFIVPRVRAKTAAFATNRGSTAFAASRTSASWVSAAE